VGALVGSIYTKLNAFCWNSFFLTNFNALSLVQENPDKIFFLVNFSLKISVGELAQFSLH